MEPRKFKHFIEQAASLPRRQRAGLADLLNSSLLQEKTAALIEAASPRACPRCRSVRLHRHGHAHGLQRYRCVDWARTFNALTGTPLARLRHRSKWLPYLGCMLQSGTVRRAAALVGIHKNTSFRWRHRFLTLARTDRVLPLGGIAEADETYLLESQKGSRHLDRPPRRRGGTARRRGLSHEQVCILVARDRTGKTVEFVTGRAPLTRAQLWRCRQGCAWPARCTCRTSMPITAGSRNGCAVSTVSPAITFRTISGGAGPSMAGGSARRRCCSDRRWALYTLNGDIAKY